MIGHWFRPATADCGWCLKPMTQFHTGCIEPAALLVADPPWRFRDALPGRGRGASRRYGTMSTADVAVMALPPLADDCVLAMWRVAAMQRDALDVVRGWGFVVKTELVWLKRTVRGRRHFGMGHHLRAEHETCLIATRGSPRALVHNVRSTFEAPVGAHSAKPDAFYALMETLYPGPRVELFARSAREGWRCYGNDPSLEHRVQFETTSPPRRRT